ncbi:MAG TPA: SDR family oxidoreductase [Frankiaceae bacterium]|nr:SDR family oxidoreductase [Frankiaceae bacterium]
MTLPPPPTFAVTGASGAIGGRVARRLAEAGAEQVLIVRDAARAPQIAGAPVRLADYDDPEALRAAFEGISTLFLVSAAEHPERVRLHRQVVDAAVEAGVTRVVYLSFVAATPDATFTFARDHYATEELLRATGLASTFLRDSMYQDFIPSFAGADGVMRGPAGDGAVAAVARDDIADVAARVLLEPERHDDRTYDITGPAAFTLTEAAELLTEVTGRPVRYENETEEQAYASRAGAGPDYAVAGWVSSYQAIANGELSAVSDAVREITGSPATSFRDLLRRNPETWAHLLP